VQTKHSKFNTIDISSSSPTTLYLSIAHKVKRTLKSHNTQPKRSHARHADSTRVGFTLALGLVRVYKANGAPARSIHLFTNQRNKYGERQRHWCAMRSVRLWSETEAPLCDCMRARRLSPALRVACLSPAAAAPACPYSNYLLFTPSIMWLCAKLRALTRCACIVHKTHYLFVAWCT
jgi:hypothetical protein